MITKKRPFFVRKKTRQMENRRNTFLANNICFFSTGFGSREIC